MTATAPAEPVDPSDEPAPLSQLLVRYVPPPGGYDEFVDAEGAVRPRWHQVAEALGGFGDDGLASRHDELARLLRSEGATYNRGGGQAGVRSPWTLDPVPLLLDRDEWTSLATAVAQRVALLDLVAADLYGPRTLLARRLIPPELVLGNPAYLQPCAGITAPGAHRLFTAAVDVVREANGEFRAIADRVQAPSGLGYALVNRFALSRVLPGLHRSSGVERLAGFVRAIRSAIARAAPDGVDEPRVVILTPGPLAETYFEHAYLASYLGYPLVEGRDLTVQNNRVWLRSLDGMDPVDVVVRRVDDVWCDPVELRPDSLLGVPGLVEVVRRGRVAVLNPLGAGILESVALSGVLEDLAPALLGEDLALRGPSTWWCGDPVGLSHVLAHFGELTLVPVRATPGARSVRPVDLTADGRTALADMIRSHPWEWAGQEIIDPSTMPAVDGDGSLVPRPVVLRTFAVSDEAADGVPGHGFRLLPGGLTRVGPSSGAPPGTAGVEETSKDTWVVSPEPTLQQSVWLPTEVTEAHRPVVVHEPAVSLPGRLAGELFASGRSAEHAELVIRLFRTVLARSDQPLGTDAGGGAQSLRVLLAALAAVTGSGGEETTPGDRTALAVLLDDQLDGSLVSALDSLVDASYSVREQLSSDTWQLIGDIEEEMARFRRRPPSRPTVAQPGLLRIQRSLLALAGVTAENMERDSTWRFVDAGRRVERSLGLIRLIRALLVERRPEVVEALLIESLLTTSESLIIFRRRAGSTMQVAAALDLLIFDQANPRSVLYQLECLATHLAVLATQGPALRLGDEERLVLEAATLFRLTDPDQLARVDVTARRRPALDTAAAAADGLLIDLTTSLRRTTFVPERFSVLAGEPFLEPRGEP